jgi:hypothetical protein
MGSQHSVRQFLKTAYVVPRTRSRTCGVVFRIDLGISDGCWRAAQEKEGPSLEEGNASPHNAQTTLGN